MKRKREKEKVIQLQVQLSKEISVVKTKVYRGSQRLLEKHKSTLKPQRERHVKMFKEINADFVIRFTPKFRMCDSVVEGRILKMSMCLLNKGYVCRGFIVKE